MPIFAASSCHVRLCLNLHSFFYLVFTFILGDSPHQLPPPPPCLFSLWTLTGLSKFLSTETACHFYQETFILLYAVWAQKEAFSSGPAQLTLTDFASFERRLSKVCVREAIRPDRLRIMLPSEAKLELRPASEGFFSPNSSSVALCTWHITQSLRVVKVTTPFSMERNYYADNKRPSCFVVLYSVYTYIYIYMYVCMYVCMYTHTVAVYFVLLWHNWQQLKSPLQTSTFVHRIELV